MPQDDKQKGLGDIEGPGGQGGADEQQRWSQGPRTEPKAERLRTKVELEGRRSPPELEVWRDEVPEVHGAGRVTIYQCGAGGTRKPMEL